MFGIDISEHNGTINWELVKTQINFAILRLGWIGNKNNHTIDKQFERNYMECKRLGIPVGVYVYCYCNSEETAKAGANWTIEKLKGKKLELPVYIDMEDSSIASCGKEKLTDICIAFNSIIEKKGLWAGVYANENWFNNYLNKEEIKKRYTTWIASYKSGTECYKGEYDMWQNSSKGKINGINGNVDTNYMYRDLVAQIKGNKVETDLQCNAHIQDIGWTGYKNTKEGIIGTEGQGKRLEAIQFKANNGLEIKYRVHIENIGWQDWRRNGEFAGTEGQALKIEAIEIESNKDLEVQEHIQDVGWMPSSKGKFIHIGTEGKCLRLEAFKIRVI